MSTNSRKRKGQSIVELAVGLIFLVPIALFLLDMATLVIANMANDNLVKGCCRAAASAVDNSVSPPIGDVTAAENAAAAVASKFVTTPMIKPVGGSFLTGFGYLPPLPTGTAPQTAGGIALYPGTIPGNNAPIALNNAPINGISTGQVGCVTTMVVTLPVPFPFAPSTMNFVSVDVEPIVSPQPGM